MTSEKPVPASRCIDGYYSLRDIIADCDEDVLDERQAILYLCAIVRRQSELIAQLRLIHAE